MRVPVYKAERVDGLAEKVSANSSITYASKIEAVTAQQVTQALLEAHAKLSTTYATNQGQFDLFYLKSVLATVGWNLNDDIFDKVEMWLARSTPEDKPFNLEHDPRRIRGHITGNYAIDDDGNIIPDTSDIDSLPAKYHVVTSGVLYKFIKCPDQKLEEEMTQTIAEIQEGKWYVSMEALFSNFDYAAKASSGETYIIKRDEESAFLTKHLRAYGGDGVYEGYKLGRVMRNIVFSGKGLVRNPANPESVIFRDVASIKTKYVNSIKEIHTPQQSVGYKSFSNETTNKESNRMPTEVDLLNEQKKSLEQTVVTATKKVEELEKRLQDMNEKQVQEKLTALANQNKEKDDKITSLEAQVKTEQAARLAAEAKVTEITANVSRLETELTAVKAEKTKANRVNAWVERTGVDTAVATKAVESLMVLSDDSFKTFLETQPAKATATPPADEKKTDDKSGQKNADVSALNDAKADKKDATPLASGGVNDDVQQVQAGLSKLLAANFLSSKNKKKESKE